MQFEIDIFEIWIGKTSLKKYENNFELKVPLKSILILK